MLRSGDAHRASLRDGRCIYLAGESVSDVTEHRGFKRSVASLCRLFDFQSAPERQELMSFEIEGGGRAHRMWQLPESHAELVERRLALEASAAVHAGFLGRTPDHVASCLSGMVMGAQVFHDHDPARAQALMEYYAGARERDLYLTYVIINPQADRSRGAAAQADPYLTAGIVDRDKEGLTIRGAKMLGTGTVMANELFVTCIQPLQENEQRYAVSFVVPVNAKGLKILSRKSFEADAGSVFDNPLSSRFDENDAVIYFDDVKIPWERVFVAGDVAMCQKQFHATPAHVLQNYQAQIRLVVKLRFLLGIAKRIATLNGILSFPQVKENLGQLAAEVGMVEGLVAGMEARGSHWGRYFVPHAHTLYTAQVLTQQLYPKFVTAIRELAGGAMITLPSAVADFAHPQLRALIEKTQQSPAADAESKVKFYKLAWDAIGSEFGSRHLQYEMFYAGAGYVTKSHSFRSYDWDAATAMVDAFLAGYSLEESLKEEVYHHAH